ncbi:unnamed protein product [Polarella glacialis]|uniref:Protein kinase domain-containing protein n=1 Tax=Polarella glacialis TaxID=89957 RepID=A0A813I7I6_POLGL|nr:unnamed protein product [Polarella glacialis]
MKYFLHSLLLLGCSCPAESASWAFAKFTDGSNCSGTPQGGEERGFPMLSDFCELSYRGTPDKSKWVWTKATCSSTEVTRIGYTDDKCTIPSGGSGFDRKWSMACKSSWWASGLAERSITCDSVHDVVIAKAYMIGPGGSASLCSERSIVAHVPIITGACYTRLDDTGLVGMKAACDGQKVVMNKYAALDCSGAGTEFFSFGGTCAQGFNKNGYLAIESGCGYPMNNNNNNSTTTTTRAPTATAATTTLTTTTTTTKTTTTRTSTSTITSTSTSTVTVVSPAVSASDEYALSKAVLSTAGSLLCCVSLCFGVWLWRRARAARNRQEAAAAADMPKTIGYAATDLWGPESSVSVYVVDASGLSVADPSVESCSEGAFQSSDMQHIMTIGIVEHWFIKPSDITPDPKSILGSGSFGIVVKGMLNYATEVAIKIPKTQFQSREESQLANEMRLFRHIRHSNIVLFHGATLMVINGGSPCLSLVLEWVNGGNFGEYMQQLRSNAVFEADGHAFAYKILLDVARGMTYLHKLTPVILHLDLKPANILVEKSVPPKGKITDFGLSRFARNSLPQPKVGTGKYMAPEVAPRKPYGPAADVFSFGRVIIWTITGEL